MGYRRDTKPNLATGDELTADMVGIGLLFAFEPSPQPDIEDTLLSASIEAMDKDDLRVFGLLVAWLEQHHRGVNADRLYRGLAHIDSQRVRAFWAGVGKGLEGRRWGRFANMYRGPQLNLLAAGGEFHLLQHGEYPLFQGGPLRVPRNAVEKRKGDILSPADLASRHVVYRWRLVIGSTYRADMWAQIEMDPKTPPAELARKTRGSFATAWQVKRDYSVVEQRPH
ncbi:MAG: hypothetical protein A2289_00295 [Deltaproteobacteria bacterium RIFOXYA12_FULL_58_15]|nr:MAG: hypothetical protein A2289_00295 [Deltaproteobacteria bacterium RIFOXYA12_FULL_58_15]OGR11725.1 MAG: hypothetical protein A2341_09395 [Deltaproteobacteria bacterium RIFOXYB12_FULL_58_9]